MDIGKVKPGYHENELTQIWNLPIEVHHLADGQLKVVSIYLDEGIFCIDVDDEPEEE